MSARESLWPLAAAVLASAAFHAVVLTVAYIAVPDEPHELPSIEARLMPAEPVAAAAPAEPLAAPAKPRAAPKRRAGRIDAAPAVIARAPAFAPSAQDTFSMDEEAVPEPAAAPPEPVPVAEPREAKEAPELLATAPSTTLAAPEPPPLRLLPRRGRIAYTLYLGMDKFEVGRTVQSWEFDNGGYRIGSVSETSGIASVFRSERRTYLSEGEITRAGLKPKSFLMSRMRRGKMEVARARFDWDARHITWGTSDEKNDAELPPGSQDFLSLLYQLSLAPPVGGRIAIPLTTGTKFETYELDVLPEENIETPLGTLRALPLRQVRKPGTESIQIWLAADYRHLPARIRFYGRDGEPTGEQVVSEVRLSEE